MGDLSLRLGLGLGLESESQRFYKRLRLESESCLEDSDSSPSLAEIVESEALLIAIYWTILNKSLKFEFYQEIIFANILLI